MAKSKKSKILAMALCASVMTGIYASPVMAEELYEDGAHQVTTNSGTIITELEGLKVIKVGKATDDNGLVKVSDDNGGLVRVGEIGGKNVRVKSDGIYLTNNDGERTSGLTANALTLEGKILTSEQLDTINDVITDGGAVKSKGDVTSKTVDGTTTYSLNTVGANTSGITRDIEGKVTTIEGAFSVDKKGHIYNANRSFQVTKDGAARFGDYNNANVRMENGVLTVNSTGETDVAKLDAQGLTLTSGATEATLSAEQIARLNTVVTQKGESIVVTADHFKNTNNSFAVDSNGAVRAANGRFKVGADGDVRAANGKFKVGADGAVRAANGKFKVGADGDVRAADGKFKVGADGDVRAAGGKFKVGADGAVRAATVNGVAIGMNADGDITLGDDIIIDDEFNSGNVAGITRKPLKDSALGNTTYIEQNTAISADGIVVTDPDSQVSTKTKYDGFYVKDKDRNIVSSLKDDGLMLTDQESGETHTLNATDIADIKGIDREGAGDPGNGTTTIEGATSFTKDGMTTTTVTTDEIGVGGSGFYANSTGITVGDGRFNVDSETGNLAISNGTVPVFQVNGETGQVNIGANGGSQTVITGNSITTETLHVQDIVLGNEMIDKEGNSLAIGAEGYINIKKDGETVFGANTENLTADYGDYSLSMDGENGFALGYGDSSLTLTGSGYTFSGPVNLGAGSEVGFNYDDGTVSGKYITLDSLVDTVNDIYDRTQGISHNADGSTTIESGTRNPETGEFTSNGSKVTIGANGATFENGADNGITNVNGGTVNTDSALVGDHESTAGGGTGTGATGDGTVTDSTAHSGQFADADSSYEFTNDANGFTGTVTGDNTSASSGVGIGNDGAFISDSVTNGDISHTVNGGDITNTVTDGSITDTVTNGDMTVTEVKDENGSATTVKDANGSSTVSSTVSQNTNGQTVSTGTGTSVNTGKDFSVTDTETGKSIYMSDIGHVEDIDSEIQNSDGSKTTVVDAVNNEAEIRRNEIERVDGRINNLENRVGKLEDRIDKVGAMAAAIANLRTMGYDPAAPTEVAVGIGQYRDETGAALGLFHYPNRDFMLSLSVSTSGDEVMGGIGATWKFGRKSPEKVAEIKKAQAEADARRAEEAKLAKAEEMKQAAKEAKIKAQQERHAKLAAERAAQAEAAK